MYIVSTLFLVYQTKAVGKVLLIHFVSTKYSCFDGTVFIKVILLKRVRSFHSLFRVITSGVLLYLPPVPRFTVRRIAAPRLRSTSFRLSGVIEISPLRGEVREPSFSEIRRNSEVARRLAIFAVKKLCRFECEETRTVRSNTEWNAVLQVFAF